MRSRGPGLTAAGHFGDLKQWRRGKLRESREFAAAKGYSAPSWVPRQCARNPAGQDTLLRVVKLAADHR